MHWTVFGLNFKLGQCLLLDYLGDAVHPVAVFRPIRQFIRNNILHKIICRRLQIRRRGA